MSLVDPVLMAHGGCGSPLESVHYCYGTLELVKRFTLGLHREEKKIYFSSGASVYIKS